MGKMEQSASSENSLARSNSDVIAKREQPLTVGGLEHALLEKYPKEDAEPWDRTGLLVGDPSALVNRVLVALDPTIDVIDSAYQMDATLVVTHHPVFLEPPEEFLAIGTSSSLPGSLVTRAISQGVSLMNIHTALDCDPEAQKILPTLLSLDVVGTLKPLPTKPWKGYGALCVFADNEPMRLDRLAARCMSVFGSAPRVWGLPNEEVSTIAVMNGAAGSAIDACIQGHVDCLICGELHYHQALEAHQRGLAIIELGHDVSENPLTALLAQAVIQAGVSPENVLIFEQSPRWFIPDATRM